MFIRLLLWLLDKLRARLDPEQARDLERYRAERERVVREIDEHARAIDVLDGQREKIEAQRASLRAEIDRGAQAVGELRAGLKEVEDERLRLQQAIDDAPDGVVLRRAL